MPDKDIMTPLDDVTVRIVNNLVDGINSIDYSVKVKMVEITENYRKEFHRQNNNEDKIPKTIVLDTLNRVLNEMTTMIAVIEQVKRNHCEELQNVGCDHGNCTCKTTTLQ